MWKESVIKDFLGISTKRIPLLNQCAECLEFDLRDKSGDLVAASGYAPYLSAPDFSSEGFTKIANLGFTNHVFSQLGGVSKDVTFYFQRGMVGGYPHIAVGMYPWWSGFIGGMGSPSWTEDWFWLNRILLGSISAVNVGGNAYTITVSGITPVIYKGDIIFDPTSNLFGTVLDAVGSDLKTSRNDWVNGHSIIVMHNYLPYGTAGAYFSAQSTITTQDLAFHRVLSDLRVGFGSVENRLGIGVGYRKKYWQIDTISGGPNDIVSLDNIILDPYNIISDTGTFKLMVEDDVVPGSVAYTRFPSDGSANFVFFTMTAVLDDFNEFVVTQNIVNSGNVESQWHVNSDGRIMVKPIIRFATMNKRVTKVRVYASISRSRTRTQEYRLIKEIDVSKLTSIGAGKGWTLGSDGTLTLSNVTDLYNAGYFQADYAAYNAQTDGLGADLNLKLGYTPTLDYVSSWDQALVTGGKTFLLNPYHKKSWKNFIFNSGVSGAGSPQYDVITAESYKGLDTKDGNDIVGIEVNTNLDFSVFRSNGYQQYDPINQVPSQMIDGNGAVCRLGIVNSDGVIFFPSQLDLFFSSGNRIQNLSEDTIRDEYRTITDANKALIVAGKDKDGSYKYYATFGAGSGLEYTFIKGKGFIKSGSQVISYYGNKQDGSILIMDSSGALKEISPTASTYPEWRSIPIDVSLLAPDLSAGMRFIVGRVRLYYASMRPITLSISFDGSSFVTVGNFPANTTALTGVATDVAADTFTKMNHGLTTNDEVRISSIVNTTGISTGTKYYVINGYTADVFQLSATMGGAAVNLGGTNGTCIVQKVSDLMIQRALRIPPGKNAKYFQIKLTQSLYTGDPRTRISAVDIEWDVFRTGLFG